jgi:hypothetical protein
MCLAPDGKIYISTGNGTRYMHVIHEPDQPGLACDLAQHEHYRQTWTANSIPYRPNYLLGPVDGTVCDSLGINNSVSEVEMAAALRTYPNPSEEAFTLAYAVQSMAGELELRDAAGRVVLRERLPAWSTMHNVQLHAAPGMYHAQLRWGQQRVSTRVILTEP